MALTGDRVPVITETHDNEVINTGLPAVSGSIRQRRKIERNTSAPLPGMLQVIVMVVIMIVAVVIGQSLAWWRSG